MKFPNWFRIVWWAILLSATTYLLFFQHPLLKEKVLPFESILLVFWLLLLLSPIYYNIEFFGVKLKQEVKDLRSEINQKFTEIKTEIKVAQNQSVTTNFGYGYPSSDEKLNKIMEVISQIGAKNGETDKTEIKVPKHNLELFEIRFNIENEIKRIWDAKLGTYGSSLQSKRPVSRQIQELIENDIIDFQLMSLLRDVLAICNNAIHGEDISLSQYKFGINVGNTIINDLKSIN